MAGAGDVEVVHLGPDSTTGTGGVTEATVFIDGVDNEVDTDSDPVSSAPDVPIIESEIGFEVVHMRLGFADSASPTMGSSIFPMAAQSAWCAADGGAVEDDEARSSRTILGTTDMSTWTIFETEIGVGKAVFLLERRLGQCA